MDLQSLVDQVPDLSGKDCVIIGWPASGKTTLADALFERDAIMKTAGHMIFHSDDYMEYHDYKRALYQMMEDMKPIKVRKIIEGMQGYRLLRKGAELKNYYPHVVIELKITEDTMVGRYEQHRKGKDVQAAINWAAMHEGILRSYRAIKNPYPAEWITIDNN